MNEKKKTKAYLRLSISTAILLILTVILAAGIGNGSNSFPFFFFGSSYPFADKYTAGNTSIAADKLEEIEIDWISGNIQIEPYSGDTIEVEEENSASLSEGDRVHSYYENGILRIQFQKSRRFSFHSITQNKALLLRIPEKFSSTPLNKVEIDNVSADISVDGQLLHTSKKSSREEEGVFHFTFEVKADYIEYEPHETMLSLEVTEFGKE